MNTHEAVRLHFLPMLWRYSQRSESVQHAGTARHSMTGDVFAMGALPVTPRWRVNANHNTPHVNPFWSYVGPRLTVWFSCSAPVSEDVRHDFCCVCSPAVRTYPTLFLM
jgi:hypothetical protein